MLKSLAVFVVMLSAVIASLPYLFAPQSEEDLSLEQQLIAGADPTELLEATASRGQLPVELACSDVYFGNANGNVYIKQYADNLYVADIGGFKAFKMTSSSYRLEEVELDGQAQTLVKAFNRCEKPAILINLDVTFLTDRE